MDDRFNEIAADRRLLPDFEQKLITSGFAIIPGLVTDLAVKRLSHAYDEAVNQAARLKNDNFRIGSTTTRVHDLVNRGVEFDPLYVYPPVLVACCRVIGRPFKLSSLLARTLRPRVDQQTLHVDCKADREGWPMVGFIVMMDDFTIDNGATRFVPGSHRWPTVPEEVMKNPTADHEDQVAACGPAGSVIVYNGSVWHGHMANASDAPRRSIQGAYIRRDAGTTMNQACQKTLERISPLAKYVLGV